MLNVTLVSSRATSLADLLFCRYPLLNKAGIKLIHMVINLWNQNSIYIFNWSLHAVCRLRFRKVLRLSLSKCVFHVELNFYHVSNDFMDFRLD